MKNYVGYDSLLEMLSGKNPHYDSSEKNSETWDKISSIRCYRWMDVGQGNISLNKQ